jgi:hypothetical protein
LRIERGFHPIRSVQLQEFCRPGIDLWPHVEMQHEPVGCVFDAIGQTGLLELPIDLGERPVIDMDCDRHTGLDVDANQADHQTEIRDLVNAYP